MTKIQQMKEYKQLFLKHPGGERSTLHMGHFSVNHSWIWFLPSSWLSIPKVSWVSVFQFWRGTERMPRRVAFLIGWQWPGHAWCHFCSHPLAPNPWLHPPRQVKSGKVACGLAGCIQLKLLWGVGGEKKRRMDLGGVVSTTELMFSRGELMFNVLVYLA